MTIIRDGGGTARAATVNSRGELEVGAVGVSEEHFVSKVKGQAYVAHIADTANTLTLATGNTYNLLYLENSSAISTLVVQKIIISVDVKDSVLLLQQNMTLASVAANNVHVPVNTNFGSGKAADGVFHNWDETGTTGITTLTGGTLIESQILPVGITILQIDGFMVLPQGNNLVVRILDGTGNSIEVTCAVRFYYDELD